MKKSGDSIAAMALGISLSLLNAGCGVFGIRTEETPKYSVVQSDGPIEVREYSESIVAKTKTRGSWKESQNTAFRILAGYIFGSNESKQKIAMTAPVTQAPSSEKIAMTAPVTQIKDGDEWVMTFTMPSQYTLDTLPKPKDSRVQFEIVPRHKIAALRYTGFWSEERNAEKAQELVTWISKQPGLKVIGAPRFAGYDPPWTLPFFRRNEIMIDVTTGTDQ